MECKILFSGKKKTRGPRWPCITHLITRHFESIGLSVKEKKFNIGFQDEKKTFETEMFCICMYI